MPILTNIINNIFDDFSESFTRSFSLAITSRVIWCGSLMLDMELVIEGFEFFIFKVFTIINNDG